MGATIGRHSMVHFDLVDGETATVRVIALIGGAGRSLRCSGASGLAVSAREYGSADPFADLSTGALDLSSHADGEEVEIELRVEALPLSGMLRGSARLSLSGPPAAANWAL